MINFKKILAGVAIATLALSGTVSANDVEAENNTWSAPTLSPYVYAHNESGSYSDVNIPHQFKRGMKHFNNGDYEKATFSFERILKKSPRDPLTNYYMGVSEQHLGNHTEAVKHLETVYKYYKASPQVYAALGKSLVARGDYEGARKLIAKLDYMATACAGECQASADIEVAKQILATHVNTL